MAQYDDPDYDPEEYDTYAVRQLAFGGGAITLPVPKDWEVRHHTFLNAGLTVPWVAGARVEIEAACFEDPDGIRDNDLEHFLTDGELGSIPDSDIPRDTLGQKDFTALTQRAGGVVAEADEDFADAQEAYRLWRRIGVLRPDRVRQLSVELFMPRDAEDGERAVEIRNVLDHLVPEAVFADRPTDADRVAPSRTLKCIAPGNTLRLRIPADWSPMERENPDGSGMYVVDDNDPRDRFTLWIDFHRHEVDGPGDVVAFAQRLAQDMPGMRDFDNVWFDPMPDRPDNAAIRATLRTDDREGKLRHMRWERLARTGDLFVQAHIAFVVREPFAEDPDILAAIDLLDAEVLNSVISDPRTRRPAGPAAGSG